MARHHGFLFPLALLSQIVCESQFHEQWESPRSASLYWPSCCLTTAANWEWHPSLPLSKDGNMNEHTQTHMHPHALDMCTHRLSHVTTFREKKLALHVFEYVFFFFSFCAKSVGFIKTTKLPTPCPLSALFLLKWSESPGINNYGSMWCFCVNFTSSEPQKGWGESCCTFGNLGIMYFLKLDFPSWIHRN